jgi:hypothetical protein
MNAQEAPGSDDLPPDLVANLRLKVRPAYRPRRWMWEIIDARDDSVIERELDFELASDARRSGLARLAELTPALPGAKMDARAGEARVSRRLVIVSRDDDALYEELRRLFADISGIEIIRDRRRSERRRRADRRTKDTPPSSVRWVERRKSTRRRSERRSAPADPNLQARGWCVVPQPDQPGRPDTASA